MQDFMILAAAKKGKETAKQAFLADFGPFIFQYLYEISGINSNLFSEIIDDVFDKCYKNGMFSKATSTYSYGTLFITKLREYIIANPSVLPIDKHTGSDIFPEYVNYLASGQKINELKGEKRYTYLEDKTKRYVFAARYFYFMNPKIIQEKLQISQQKFERIISGFHSFKTTDYDCCFAASLIEPELLEFFNMNFYSEYKTPSDIIPSFPITDLKQGEISSKKLMNMKVEANKFTLTYIFPAILFIGFIAIIILKLFF